MINLTFKNHYFELGAGFYQTCMPMPVEKPELIHFNHDLAAEFGAEDNVDKVSLAEFFSGNVLHASCKPLAMAYAGHQFGHFNPQLGDGRACFLGELEFNCGGSLDIQLKGSGQTAYSRNGDGRSALGPVLREYLLSEAMYKLGVPTTRALAAVATGELIERERLVPGAIITRAATSFIRVGSFQYFHMKDDKASVKQLADYVIERNYPEIAKSDTPYTSLFKAIVKRQASLIAGWMQFGFIHGVMNTDNMSIAGETIDYGPCAFMDFYTHSQVYSSIDRDARYAYSNQPSIGLWNLSRLAETFLPLFAVDSEVAVNIAKTILQKYIVYYETEWLAGMRAKCGLNTGNGTSDAEDKELLESLLDVMNESKADFTLTFYHLSKLAIKINDNDVEIQSLFTNSEALDAWLVRWRQRLLKETTSDTDRQAGMQTVNPVYIPRNHQVESVIRAAEDNNDFEPFYALHKVLQMPFSYQQGKDNFMLPPTPEEVVHKTFCGT